MANSFGSQPDKGTVPLALDFYLRLLDDPCTFLCAPSNLLCNSHLKASVNMSTRLVHTLTAMADLERILGIQCENLR